MTRFQGSMPIITGFQAFGEHQYNPSWTVAEAMAEQLGVQPRLLPVTYTMASQFAAAHLKAAHPENLFFIHFGLSADRGVLSFECLAKNERDCLPDNLECTLPISTQKSARALLPEGRVDYQIGESLRGLVEIYEKNRPQELPQGVLSQDCGTYVCNALLYHSLRACEDARKEGQTSKALFIHVPAMNKELARSVGIYMAKVFSLAE